MTRWTHVSRTGERVTLLAVAPFVYSNPIRSMRVVQREQGAIQIYSKETFETTYLEVSSDFREHILNLFKDMGDIAYAYGVTKYDSSEILSRVSKILPEMWGPSSVLPIFLAIVKPEQE